MIIGADPEVCRYAIDFRKNTLKVPDCIIAATAAYLNLPLVTGDKHFNKLQDEIALFPRVGTADVRNQAYWIPKIEQKLQHDKLVKQKLLEEGYRTIRFWHQEIKKASQECARKVMRCTGLMKRKWRSLRAGVL